MDYWRTWRVGVVLGVVMASAPAGAEPQDVRIPLRDGRLHLQDLAAQSGLPTEQIKRYLDLDAVDGSVDLSGLPRSLLVAALAEASLGGWSVRVEPDALVMTVDPDKLPAGEREIKESARRFTAELAADATAAHARRLGLHLPPSVDASQPMVILIHGLDGLQFQVSGLIELIREEGLQVGAFAYPSDQPLADSARMLQQHLHAVVETFPGMPVYVVAHSMGGVIARAAVEAEGYPGGVERMILLATPNSGSEWARLRLALELKEHYLLWRSEPEWDWTWAITDGLGEAGDDLTPGSAFLEELGRLPRREGVAYTLIVGDRHEGYRMTADAIDALRQWVPAPLRRWTEMSELDDAWREAARSLREAPANGDGPVTLDSARLEGVDDVVLLHADHSRIVMGDGQSPPAAWDAIRQRLLSSQ